VADREVIRASEIGQYAFCARAWWFATVKGYRSENRAEMEQGTRQHRAHGRVVASAHLWQRLGLALILLAILALLAWLLLNLGG
jgi:CRISPR/Cas system-associated exonuclease Cas4 (RecB family)